MKVLFVNATFRENSRTLLLAKKYFERYEQYDELYLGNAPVSPLNAASLAQYGLDVKNKDYSNSMYDYAKQFAKADEIIIAAPFYNFSIPAALHDYLEMVCSQGVTFDLDADGNYVSLCQAKKLVYITTAGGYIPKEDHSFGYIRQICDEFFKIDAVICIKADGIDLVGNDCQEILKETIQSFKE